MKTIELTEEQRYNLEKLWFIYGNHGKKHTHRSHRFIQCFLEQGEDTRGFFKPDLEVIEAVDEVLKEEVNA